jgi:hypothetical protein
MLDTHMPTTHIQLGDVTEIVGSAEFDEWFQALDDGDTDAVARVVDLLEMQGPTLPFPYSSDQGHQAGTTRTSNPIAGSSAPRPLCF